VAVKRIPVTAAKAIAEKYGYDQVIILARKVGEGGGEHMTTYGRTRAMCGVIAEAGRFLQLNVLGWFKAQAPCTCKPPAEACSRCDPGG
jgi:hypothetical protein